MSILLGEPPVADVVTTRQLRVLHLGGPELEGFLRDYPPVMYRMLKAVAMRLRNANRMAHSRWRSWNERPFPPGDYPVVVVGSGPGGLQASYYLRHLGIEHAVISADPAPGGMFRRFPFFQRLLSWTKPYGPVPRDDRFYYWYDWNSLLAEEPENRAIMPDLMDGTSSFPSRPEMELNLATFVERTGLQMRYDCPWGATRRDGERFVLRTTDGDYRCQVAIFAVGVAEPYKPETPGFDLVAALRRHALARDVRRQAAVHRRQGELRLRAGHRPAPVGAAHRACLAAAGQAVGQQPLAGRCPGALRPARRGRDPGRRRVHPQRLDLAHRAHWRWLPRPLRTLRGQQRDRGRRRRGDRRDGFRVSAARPAAGSASTVFGRSQLPPMTNYWESASVPGIYFAGTIGQGVSGMKKYGLPANSGAVHGARYNARTMV